MQGSSQHAFSSTSTYVASRLRWCAAAYAGARRRGLIALSALAIAVTPGFAAGQPKTEEISSSAPLRAMLWLQPGTDEVLDRIRGQTNDLRVELLVDALDPMPGELGAQLRMAYALSAQQSVSLVIWFVKHGDAEQHFIVNIAIAKTQRLLTRDLGPIGPDTAGAGLSSAVMESAAVVVRAAIQAVLSGMTIGEIRAVSSEGATQSQMSGESMPSAAQAAPLATTGSGPWRDTTRTPPVATPSEEAPDHPERHERPFAIGVEWLAIDDGPRGNSIAECANLRAERRVMPLAIFAGGGGCLNRSVDATPYGSFRVARQQGMLGANWVLLRTGLDLSAGVQAGVAFYERTTLKPLPLGVNPHSSALHVLGVFGPEVRLAIPARGSLLQAGFTLGVDFLTNTLKFGYQAGPNRAFGEAARARAVQPYVALGLALRF